MEISFHEPIPLPSLPRDDIVLEGEGLHGGELHHLEGGSHENRAVASPRSGRVIRMCHGR